MRQESPELVNRIAALEGQIATLTQLVAERLPRRLVSLQEAAEQVGVSVKTARRMVASGRWCHTRVGRVIRIDLGKVLG